MKAGIGFFLVFIVGACAHMHPENPFLKGIVIEQFEQTSPLTVYNDVTIFRYMNGEAEVYFSYGYKLLYSQVYESAESGGLIIVDAYDMGTVSGAQGVFDHYAKQTGSEIHDLGHSAWTDKVQVLFCRGKYFVRMYPDSSAGVDFKPTLQEIMKLAQSWDRALSGS